MFKPLDGVKVIDLTYFVAGPGAARILADWGADVIKVEPSFGDPGRGTGATMSCPTVKDCNPFYTAYNANKRGLSLNLKSDEGKAVLYKLLESADVFVSSYRTGALRRLGLDYDSLSKKFPHLIWAQINGFGDFGPAKDNAGFDTVAFWARSGAMIDITEKDTSPVNPLIGFGDATPSCSLSGGICAALYQKAKTGKGCKVMVSLFAQAIWSESAGMVSTQYGDEYPKTRLNPGSPVMDTFKSADDKWFYMSILEPDRYNDALMKELGRNDLVGDPRYCTAAAAKAHSSELVEILSAEFAKHTMDEIAAAAGLARREVTAALESVVEPLSLDEPVYTDGGDAMYVIDQVRDPDSEESWISGLQFRDTVAALSPREKRIMELRYLRGKTQMEVAQEIGISQAQVSRLEKGALQQFHTEG